LKDYILLLQVGINKLDCGLEIEGADIKMTGSLREIKVLDITDSVVKKVLASTETQDLLSVSLAVVDKSSPKYAGGMARFGNKFSLLFS
jgi:hypothetical protein